MHKVLVVVVVFATSMSCLAQGKDCTLAGSWYGGMPEAGNPYYHATFTAKSAGQFSGMFQADFVYGPPYVAVTHWTGDVSKTAPQTFHGYFLAMAAFDPTSDLLPPEVNPYLPEMDFISYKVEFLDCNTFRGTLDVWYTYYNFTNDIRPLVDPPLPPGSVWNVDPPIVEVYHRVPNSCTGCGNKMGNGAAAPAQRLGRSPNSRK